MRRLFGREFAAEIRLGAALALFRVFAIPRISAILAETRAWERRPEQRLGRTVDLLRVLVEQGYDSGPGAAALARLNTVHARHAIANEDFLYVLTAFVTEPARVIARCGRRPLTAVEQAAACVFWREVGVRMGIREIPPTLAAMRAFQAEYEATHRRYAASNQRTAEAAVSALSQRVPAPLRGAVLEALLVLLEPEVRCACGFCGDERPLGRVLDVLVAARRRLAFAGRN
ncbi:oxygenase MpaB family protein [Nannocystis punicea]|uniref:Oxygenase MpaB family protein n=1 Tax=Nannocystis punicea TaxID=2995304 RepID=A0ABY7H276_9BACT|nr:oxygenase MpaB family protein [Nannocystis poenicansa]WAS93359.1 oxygenase MpaB family protein [Nannocystis poenicansa]